MPLKVTLVTLETQSCHDSNFGTQCKFYVDRLVQERRNSIANIETEKPSGWLPWSSLGTLKASFNVPSDDQGSHPSDDQGSHPDDLSVSVNALELHLFCIDPSVWFTVYIQEPLVLSSMGQNHHHNDVIMIINVMASQITSLTIVYSTVYSGTDQRKHRSYASLAFARGIQWWLVNSPHKGPVMQKIFPFDDFIMVYIDVWAAATPHFWCNQGPFSITYLESA